MAPSKGMERYGSSTQHYTQIRRDIEKVDGVSKATQNGKTNLEARETISESVEGRACCQEGTRREQEERKSGSRHQRSGGRWTANSEDTWKEAVIHEKQIRQRQQLHNINNWSKWTHEEVYGGPEHPLECKIAPWQSLYVEGPDYL